MTKNKDTYSYKGWLISDNFLKRVAAVIMYNALGQIILFFSFFLIFMVFILLVDLFL